MIISISLKQLNKLVIQQVRNLFLLSEDEATQFPKIINEALNKIDICFSKINNKHYRDGKFNPYHSGQYAIFLYFMSRIAWQNKHITLADKIYYLNKTLNGCDLLYVIDFPDCFFLEHPVASVMGRASYGNYFVFQQGCTVGGNHAIYPQFGEFVWLFANSTVIGNSKIGDNVFISAHSYVKDTNIPGNSIVFGQSPNLTIKQKPAEYFYNMSPFKSHNKLQ